MTQKTEKNKKIIWIVVTSIAIIAACFLLYILMNSKKSADDSPSTSTPVSTLTPSETTALGDVSITQGSYDVYEFDNIDFGFIVANIHVATDKTVNVPLSSFQTSEGLVLNETSSYIDTLLKNSYDLSKENLSLDSLNAAGAGFDTKVFIPFKNKSLSTITVSCDFNEKNDLSFSLANVNTTADQWKVKTTASPTSTRSFSVQVEDADEVNASKVLGKDDQQYFMPSTARVFLFHVSVNAAEGKPVKITSAVFSSSKYGDVIAESSDVHTAKFANILNQEITESGEGYIFVLMLDPGHVMEETDGTLSLTMADVSQNTSVDVKLK